MRRAQAAVGGVCGPLDAYLVMRGLRTMEVRVERMCETAGKVADFLNSHEKVEVSSILGDLETPSHFFSEIDFF